MSSNPDNSMVRPETFQCPTCGTPLKIGTEPSIQCRSCGNTVFVPEKYRPQPPQIQQPMQQQPTIQKGDIQQAAKSNNSRYVLRGLGCIVLLVIVAYIGLVAWSFIDCN